MCDIGAFINTVELYPHLYDKKQKLWKDAKAKENSWLEIGNLLNITVDDCKRIWKNLRDRYARERKVVLHSGSQAAEESQWEYWQALSFLEPHVRPRKTIGNICVDEKNKEKTVPVEIITVVTDSEFYETDSYSPPDEFMTPVFSESSVSSQNEETSQSTQSMSPISRDILNNDTLKTTASCSQRQIYRAEREGASQGTQSLLSPTSHDVLNRTPSSSQRQINRAERERPLQSRETPPKKKLRSEDSVSSLLNIAKEIQTSVQRSKQEKPQHPAETFGAYVASMLMEMRPEVCKEKMKQISEILYS